MPLVELPDGRSVEFPDGASLKDIDSAIRRDFAPLFSSPEIADRAERQAKLTEERRKVDAIARLGESDLAAANALGGVGEFIANIPANILNIPQAIEKATGLEPMDVPFRFQRGQPIVPEVLPQPEAMAQSLSGGGSQVPDANAALAAGLLKGGEDLVRGIATPEVVMTAGGAGVPGAARQIVKQAVPAVFAEQMIAHTPEAYQEFGKSTVEGSPAEAMRAGVGAVGSSAMVAGISAHGIQKVAAENVRVGNTETAKALAAGEKGKDAESTRTSTEGVRGEEGLQRGTQERVRVRDDEGAGMEARTGETPSEAASQEAKLGQPLPVQGGISPELQRSVIDSVIASVRDKEVAGRIVASIPVNVMDQFIGIKNSSQAILSDPSVLADALSRNRDTPIAGRILKEAEAITGAKEPVLGNVPTANIEGLTAPLAGSEFSVVSPRTIQGGTPVGTEPLGTLSGNEVAATKPTSQILHRPDVTQVGEGSKVISGEQGTAPVVAKTEVVPPENRAVEPSTPPPTPQPESPAGASVKANVTPEVTPATQEIVGMGGATPAEFQPTQKFVTKNTVEQVNKERKARGLEELPEHEVFPNKEAKRQAEQRLDDDPQAADKLMDELGEKSRPLDPVEQGVMVIDRAKTFNSYFDELRKFRQALEDGSAELAAGAEKNAEFFAERLSRIDKTVSEGGAATKAGQALQAYKMGIREDMSLEMMTLKAMRAKGRKLTVDEASEIQRLHEENLKLQKQLDEVLAREKALNTEADTGLATAEAVTSARKQKSTTKTRDLAAEQKQVVDHLKEHFNENGDLAGQEISIKKLMELLVLRENITERLPMETRVHEILRDLVGPTITREQAMDLMSGYGKSKRPSPEFAKRTVRDINAQILQVRKLLDYFQGQPPKATGLLRDAPSDITRQWTKMVNEAKKAFHLDVPSDPAAQARQLKSALDAVKTRLTNRLKDLQQEVATRQKIIKSKASVPSDAETVRLRNEIAELKKVHDEIFGRPELTDAQRLERLEASTERQIAELERQLKSGEIFPSRRVPFSGDSPKLQAARARLEELKSTRQYARDALQPKPEKEQQLALNYLLRLRQRAAEYQERTARGDFAKKPRPEREHSSETLQALADVEKAKSDYQRKLHQWEREQFTTGQKIWDGIQQTRGTLVNIKSSFDFSAPRQALLSILSNATRIITNPTRTKDLLGNPIGRMFQAWASEARARTIEQRILNRPNAKSGADKAAGIEYTKLDADTFTKYEENAHSYLDRLADQPFKTGNVAKTVAMAPLKVGAKVVRMSNRAFITFLNETRASLFDELLRVNYKDRPPTKNELAVIGNLVNIATGRGKMNPMTSKVASEVLWAPKLLASRIQAITGQPLWTGKFEGTARARKIVAKEYARIIATGYLLWTVSRLFDEKKENDLRSSDFGKIVRDDTRIDPWGGMQQLVVLSSRAGTGETKGSDNKIRESDLASLLANFTRNKLRPDVGAIWNAYDIAMKRVKPGRPDDALEFTGELVAPLPLQDVVIILREHGFTEGMIIEMLGQFGAGVSYQGDKERGK